MSKVVELADLEEALADFGSGFLLTLGSEERIKLVSVAPTYADGVFTISDPGRGSCANAAQHPAVTLLYPPLDQPGMSLIVDGAAAVDGVDVVVRPASAILHKPA